MFNIKRVSIIAFFLPIIGIVGAIFTYSSYANSEPALEEFTFREVITDLQVESDNAKIEILPSMNDSTDVVFEIDTNKKSRYNLEAAVENGVLKVKVKEKILQFFNFDFNWKPIITKVYLPEDSYDSIHAKTINGTVHIENLFVKAINARSTNGSLIMQNLHTEQIVTEVENGQINFEAVFGDLQARTTNGRIELNADRLNYPIDFETVNGRIKVQVDETPENAEIRAEVVNDSSKIFGIKSNQSTTGNGEIKINLKTVNGSITVEN
ncbi:DUF4097 family beta strand repeat-containing protein [Oceanobacillus sp. CAU 1775]